MTRASLPKRGVALAAVMSLFLLVTPGGAGAELTPTVSFEDDFEAATIDSFWTSISEDYGTVTLSTDQAYSGTQSLRMQSYPYVWPHVGNRHMSVGHDFPQLLRGTVSVWFYDTGVPIGLYSGLTLYNLSIPWGDPGYTFGIGVKDFDRFNYWFTVGGVSPGNWQVAERTVGWHQFSLVLDDHGVTGFIDGQEVGFAEGEFAFDTVYLYNSGLPRVATYYFDDFDLQAYPADLVEVAIDVKPGTDKNCVNSNGHGVIPVAILSTAEFDATEVDPATVALDGQPVRTVGKKGKLQAHAEDVTGDGLDDLVVQIQDIADTYDETSTLAVLMGATFGGVPIQGTDSICLVP